MISFKGKSLIYLAQYDEAIELYKKYNDEYNNKNELGMIYYNYKNNYRLAFECFESIKNYKFALKSIIKMNNITKIFDYTNQISSYLGIIGYNNIYKKYINSYFKKYFIERKKLNEDIDLDKFKIGNNNSIKKIILIFIKKYLNQINEFENKKIENEDSIKEISQIEFNELQEELNIDLDTIHFINAYYFNKTKNIILELLKLFPEFIFFKSNSFDIENYIEDLRKKNTCLKLLNFKEERKNKKEIQKFIIYPNRDKYYTKMGNIINYLIENSEFEDKIKFTQNIIPFLINHGYFYYEDNNNFTDNKVKIKLFWDLSLNNYDLISEKYDFHSIMKKMDDNTFLLYYLSYSLRIGITHFIKYKEDWIINDLILKKHYNFSNLKKVINLFYNNYYSYNEKNYDINYNLNIIFDYLVKKEEKELELDENKIIEYLDIGSSLSLLLIANYFSYYNYNAIIMETQELFEFFQKFYLLCNLLSSSFIESFSYNKKLILFSLFSVFNVSPLPSHDKLFNIKIFQVFNSINGALLNCNSILFDSVFFNSKNKFNSKFFDIFSNDNKLLFENNFYKMLNLEGNNIIINYNTLPVLFRFMLSTLIEAIFKNSFEYLDFTPNIFAGNKKFNNKYCHYYSSILYYHNQLNFYCNDDRLNSLNLFWTINCKKFSGLRFKFPLERTAKDLNYFLLNDYLKDLLLFNDVRPNIIYSFLINYLHEQKKGNFHVNKNDTFLLIFLLEDIWNIIFHSSDYKEEQLKSCYLEKLIFF